MTRASDDEARRIRFMLKALFDNSLAQEAALEDPRTYLGSMSHACRRFDLVEDWNTNPYKYTVRDKHEIFKPINFFGLPIPFTHPGRLVAKVVSEPAMAQEEHERLTLLTHSGFKYEGLEIVVQRKSAERKIRELAAFMERMLEEPVIVTTVY